MIFINPAQIHFPVAWVKRARKLSLELKALPPAERRDFIDAKRATTWADPAVIDALRGIVGNKCWYSEVHLEGADPNIDHFRPKGRVTEVDNDTLEKTGKEIENGYWWLAFESKNFRLSCMHSNQRRVDEETDGGKADFFPVNGDRASEETEWDLIEEDVLPLDPCSKSDMALIWFDPNGTPCLREWRRPPTNQEACRLKATIWLYHLDKIEITQRRADHIQNLHTELKNADIEYKLWDPKGAAPNLISKGRFDSALNRIIADISEKSEFAGAKRCAVQIAIADYPWIEEFGIVTYV